MAYEDPIFDYEDPTGEEKDGKRGRGCIILVSIVVILAMIGVSFPSLFWLISLREAAMEPIVVTVEVSATPQPTAVPVAQSTAVSTSTPQETTEAATDTAVNRIAYVNNDGQIMTINPNGSGARILTSGTHRFQFPAWSPDSTRLAVIGQNPMGGAVYVIDAAADAAEPGFLYQGSSDEPFYLYWAPDGEKIGFISNDRLSGIALHVVAADGSDESRVVSAGEPFYWHWADDSAGMLIHSGGFGVSGRVEMIPVESASGGRRNDLGQPGLFQSPGISADGRFWAYAERVDREGSQLVVMDTVNGAKQVEEHLGAVAMNWNPVTPTLAFISGDTMTSGSFIGSLRVLDAETGEVTLLSRDKVVAFFWSPDGRYIAALGFMDSGAEREINVANPKRPFAKPSAQLRLPQLELVIYDMTTMEGKELLRFVPSLAFLSQFLPYFDQYALSHQIWSPDSTALVLPMLGENSDEVVVVSIQSGEEQLIASGSMPFWSHR